MLRLFLFFKYFFDIRPEKCKINPKVRQKKCRKRLVVRQKKCNYSIK